MQADRYDHGTRQRYRAGCSCLACRSAAAVYARERYQARAQGDANGFVPATEVRAHLRQLRQRGVGIAQIARLAGVRVRFVQRVLSGEHKHVRQQLATRLLSLRPVLAGGTRVPSWRAWRLIRSLRREGYTDREIARRLGLRSRRLRLHHEVRVSTHLKIATLYRLETEDEPETTA